MAAAGRRRLGHHLSGAARGRPVAGRRDRVESRGGERRQFPRRGDRPRPSAAVQPRLRRPGGGLACWARCSARSCCWRRPTRMFELLIPLLLGFATVLFAFAGRITQWLRARASASGKRMANERHQHAAGAADLDLWRLFRRRRRHAAARRADDRDRGRLSPRPTWRRTWCRASTPLRRRCGSSPTAR